MENEPLVDRVLDALVQAYRTAQREGGPVEGSGWAKTEDIFTWVAPDPGAAINAVTIGSIPSREELLATLRALQSSGVVEELRGLGLWRLHRCSTGGCREPGVVASDSGPACEQHGSSWAVTPARFLGRYDRLVILNGTVQVPGEDYVLGANGERLTFEFALKPRDVLVVASLVGLDFIRCDVARHVPAGLPFEPRVGLPSERAETIEEIRKSHD